MVLINIKVSRYLVYQDSIEEMNKSDSDSVFPVDEPIDQIR